MDQAATLRRLMLEREAEGQPQKVKVRLPIVLGNGEARRKESLALGLQSVFENSGITTFLVGRETTLEKSPKDRFEVSISTQGNYVLDSFNCFVLESGTKQRAEALSVIKRVRRDTKISKLHVIVNSVTDGQEGQKVFKLLEEVVSRFTDVQLIYLGHCVSEGILFERVRNRDFLLDLKGETPAAACFRFLAKRIGQEVFNREQKLKRVDQIQDEWSENWSSLLGEMR